MPEHSFIIKGDICHSLAPGELECAGGAYLVCEDGRSAGIFREIPERWASLPVEDCTGRLVLPGLVDLHVHASQFAYRGTGMDVELLDWLNAYAFPEESRFASHEYAREAYRRFVEDVRRGALASARTWLDAAEGRYERTTPMLTPRFIPSCSAELLRGLGEIRRERGLAVQSHLSENRSEVELVHTLFPDSAFYGAAYDRFGLFGGDHPCIMAHCVLSEQPELELIRERGVYIAHCPASNMNVSSGIAPVRRFLDMGLSTGLGSDVAGGTVTSIFRAMADAIQVSKLRWRLVDGSLSALTAPEAFHLGTAGGGGLFNTGSFRPGMEFDAIVMDDRRYSPPGESDIPTRLERTIYLSDDRDIEHKFVRGRRLF